MGKYSLSWANQATTTGLTTRAAAHTNAAAETAEFVEILVTGAGASGPQDYQHSVQATVGTFSTTGASTTTTPTPMTAGIQPASNLAAGITHTTEPGGYVTVSAVVFGFNQRGGMRWAVPQGEGMRGLGALNTANTGVGVRIASSTAGNVDGHLHWWEPAWVLFVSGLLYGMLV